jgi:hypothetical protein
VAAAADHVLAGVHRSRSVGVDGDPMVKPPDMIILERIWELLLRSDVRQIQLRLEALNRRLGQSHRQVHREVSHGEHEKGGGL